MMIVDMTKAAKALQTARKIGRIGRGDRRIDQVPESRNLRYDAQNLGRKAVNDIISLR